MIKAVIFDIDGVLIDSFEANLKFFQDLMVHTGYKPPTRKEFSKIFHLSLWDAVKTLTKLDSKEKIEKISHLGRGRKIPYFLNLIKMPGDAEATIKTLSKQYQLGIVTSRVKENVWEAPKLKKLKKYFKVAVSYDDTKNHKPHPEPLLYAAKKLKVKPEEAVYIGDVENDVKAAKSAGMKVIIYSKVRVKGADARTSLFKQLPQLISKI